MSAAGQLIVGASASTTMTVKEQFVVPAKFVAVTVTTVVPTGNVLPDGIETVTTGVGMPVAVAEKLTGAEHWPGVLLTTMFAGQVRIGRIRTSDSTAPMSMMALSMRIRPCWSVGGVLVLSPASMARLPGSSACVN